MSTIISNQMIWEWADEDQWLLYYNPTDGTPKIMIGEIYWSISGSIRWINKLTDWRDTSSTTIEQGRDNLMTSCLEELNRLNKSHQRITYAN
ncbi:hypothetical protein PQC16_gp176 [Rhizobium phage RHph_TM30]|uniref:Uncharacterized protein n=1 Tax=Rhizobium phage RHph_TM30 TaxID=2509764 RepID=A0A7S5UVF6_9CAUD|nr:hypothetical protein PQC16_gp176 [Rhizobium phage RHph_TM30]QIG71283.1 hypothetical protein EVB93_176 [Rhizobium phage RHph_TM30]QIG72009.1 hypothetical protein EVB95_175 [Rhizobium phage RHph_TM2_3B]QIG72372.1 hypothetical protein EVB96_176 [Rhizobium phage RHph_TM3_3_6]